PRQGLHRRRLRLARRRLLDVPGDEPRHRGAGRARGLDLEPQLRGPPGARRTLAPRLARDGRRGRHRGALRRHPGVEMRAIETITGPVSVIMRDVVATDQFITKLYLKRLACTAYGAYLFSDYNYEIN